MAALLETLVLLALPVTLCAASESQGADSKAAFTFDKVEYFHRYTKGHLHEFTPKGQSDLKKWTDMFTINDYPAVKDGEALAKSANSVLETYMANQAMVVRTDSVPRTPTKPAEHLIVVLFPRKEFIEVAFTRFLLDKEVGASLVYSHRIYSAKAGDAMSEWLKANGERIERALMAIPGVPKH